jgi:hypothetical protein
MPNVSYVENEPVAISIIYHDIILAIYPGSCMELSFNA